MQTATFTLQGLRFSYAHATVLHGLDLTLEPGRVHGIVGPNGSGKSTLLALLAGHLKPEAGTVRLNGNSVPETSAAALARICALVPQETATKFPFTVFETILMGRHPHIPRFARPTANDLDIVDRAMATMDLNKLAHRPLSELSGGERQRTSVARGLAQDTPALLLDEPTASMDIRHGLMTMTELRRLAHEENRTVVTVLHDLNLAARFCDAVAMLDKGCVHAYGNVSRTLTPENIETVFQVRTSILSSENGPIITYA